MATFGQGSEFDMEKDDFSALEIRDSGKPGGFHYFYDTKRSTLITDFVLEDRPRVSTMCQITLIKKDDGFSPRIRLWKKDKTKFAKQPAEHIVDADATTTVIKATVDTDSCHENFWKLIDFIQSFKGILLPDSVFRVVTGDSAVLAQLLQNEDRQVVLDAVQAAVGESLTEKDIGIIANRKKQLAIFKSLLTDPAFFEQRRLELQKPGKQSPGDEGVWQNFFEKNQWIFGYGLSLIACEALDGEKLEKFTTGANIFTGAGKRSDAVMRSKGFISSLVFGEIKTPAAPLLEKEPYRKPDVYQTSRELNGAVAQVQKTAEKAIRQIGADIHRIFKDDGTPTDIQVSSIRPRRVVVTGNLEQLAVGGIPNPEKTSAFEVYRNSIHDVEIITFDELYERARFIVEDV
ncbi:Shedu immune nuclease family protein [Mycolicibacterium sp. 120266]|uniref:Shedu immune nuclease family protein n=1 Tax=Mycolicibacterium sp. 120266 TaxID=3090601 RepID=UPI00299D6A9A|nr:Shedu immune nuclease family protein [Mycolicibacterium sp. 120266]MDX1870684.1 Shedu immune nuclease family protein [Mycolicibacterium sp. 120266]